MPQTKRQIEQLLAAAGARPRHRFGQNFMIEPGLVRAIADAGEIRPGDTVIEVGPGTGTLTEELLERVGEAGRVVAVEIDRDLAAALRGRFAGDSRVSVIEGDALAGKHALSPALLEAVQAAAGRLGEGCRLVANLPYNIASPLIVELLLAGVGLLAFTVQKEVAQRLRAGPGDGKAYGTLSVVARSLAEVEMLRTIPPTAFWPQPKVESALVRLRRRQPAEDAERARAFAGFVTRLFSQRRKTLRRALAPIAPNAEEALARAGLDAGRRPEELDPEALRGLFEAVCG